MGKLIVIEGSCDGVGKSLQYKLLVDRLLKDKETVVTTHHFPSYGTYQGRPVEEYLKGNYGKISSLSPYFVNSLYAQDRAITWITGLKQEYDKGNIIVLDRYTTSSLIYQSSVIDNPKEKEDFINYIDVLGNEHSELFMKIVNANEVDIIYNEDILIKYKDKYFHLFADKVSRNAVLADSYMIWTNSEQLAQEYIFEKKEQFVFIKYITRKEIGAVKIVKTPVLDFKDIEQSEEIIEGDALDSWLSELI